MSRLCSAALVGLFVLASGTVACSFAGGQGTSGDGDGDADAGSDVDAAIPVGSYRRALVIEPALTVGAAINVPIAIRLVRDTHIADESRDDGADLFVIDDDGRQLPLELEQFDGDDGTVLGWVVVPAIPAGGKTIHLHYGGDVATGNDKNLWSDSADLVWHMAQPTGDVVLDSGPGALHATRNNGTLGQVPGLFGNALELTDAALLVESGDFLNQGRNSFSLSMWFNQTEAVGNNDTGFFKGGPTVNRPGYQIELGTGDWTAQVRDNDGFFNTNDEVSVRFGDEATLGSTGWHQLVMVLDRQDDSMKAYVDGALVDLQSLGRLSSISNSDDEARTGGVADVLRGFVDEVRVLRTPVTADWVALDYENGVESLVTVGDVEPLTTQ